MKKAFSLIELLISLITISVILASMAPIITHKMKHGGVSIGTKKLSMKCPSSVGSQCTLCLGNQCIACPIGCGAQFKNTLTCKCETCTVANCTNCTSGSNQCDTCKLGCTKISNNECKCCPSGQYIVGNTCTTCPKGYKCSNNAATKCSGTQYQNETGKDSCKECAGVVSSDRTSCSNCASGTYWHTTNKTCTTCPTGNKCIGDNQKTACIGSEYQDESGKDSCKSCLGVVNSTHNGCRSCSYFGSSCSTCTYDSCTSYNCSSGEYPTSTGCASCSSKFGSSCATCNSTSCLSYSSCSDGKYLSNGTCSNCPTGCKKCSSESNCTECDTDYVKNGTTCKYDPCEKYQAVLVEGDYEGKHYKFCMKRKNAGDESASDLIGIATGQQVNSGTTKNPKYEIFKEAHCWKGTTTKSCTDAIQLATDFPAWDYDGCTRTVCNWLAANQICNVNLSKYGQIWKLPSLEQLYVLKSQYTNASGTSGLQFCDMGSSTKGAPYCYYDEKLCLGADYNRCEPALIWGIKKINTNYYYYLTNYGGFLMAPNTGLAMHAYSVRCVMDL